DARRRPDPVHPRPLRPPREGDGDRRRAVRDLADPDQHARGCAQRQSRTARGGEVVPLERAAALAARDHPLHAAVLDDRRSPVDCALPRRYDRRRVSPLLERPRRPDHPQHGALPDRERARLHPRDHDHRHDPARDRPRARGLLRTLEGGRVTAVTVIAPRTRELSPRWEVFLLRLTAGIILLALWEGLVTWLSPSYITRPS